MRIRELMCAVPLLFSVACQQAAAGEDVAGSTQALAGVAHFEKLFRKEFNLDEITLVESIGQERVYAVASMSSTIAGQNGAQLPANFYYPQVSPCVAPVETCEHVDAFPMVPLLQGGNVPKEQYSLFATKLASYGFVVVVPDLKQVFGPPGSPALYFTSQWVSNWVEADLQARDADAASPLYGIVDTASMGLTGHSFGAAAALAVVQGTCQPPFCFGPFYQRPASLKAAVVYGFQNCDPTTHQCLYPNTSAAPSMIINGGVDDPGLPAQTAYNSLTPARALVVLEDVNHFGLTNDDLASPYGPNPEPNGVDQAVSIAQNARWTALWLRAQIEGSERATEVVFQSGGVYDATVTSQM